MEMKDEAFQLTEAVVQQIYDNGPQFHSRSDYRSWHLSRVTTFVPWHGTAF